MIPLSIHKGILLHAIQYVLCEPDDGSSFFKEYKQLKKIADSETGSREQYHATAYFDGTPCQAYEHLPEELLYQEIMAWRDSLLTGYNLPHPDLSSVGYIQTNNSILDQLVSLDSCYTSGKHNDIIFETELLEKGDQKQKLADLLEIPISHIPTQHTYIVIQA